MNEEINQTDNFTKLSGYSLISSIIGTVSYMLMFPSGIYPGFLMSVLGITGGMLSRPYTKRSASSSAAVVIGIINIIICIAAFHGLDSLYTLLRDPEAGPQISSFILDMLSRYGVSPETFVQIMKP